MIIILIAKINQQQVINRKAGRIIKFGADDSRYITEIKVENPNKRHVNASDVSDGEKSGKDRRSSVVEKDVQLDHGR